VECIVSQDDLHNDMIGRKKAVREQFFELQQQLVELQQLKDQMHLDGLNQIVE